MEFLAFSKAFLSHSTITVLILKEKGIKIVALCDTDKSKLQLAKKNLDLDDSALYDSDEKFFARGKIADILFVCTQDALHFSHAIKGMKLGYDLLLEKPIATSIKECDLILKTAHETGRKVFVCHVLRYAPFFNEIKNEIRSGNYGKVITISMTENVAYWHQAHSYVRGNWRNDKQSTPMIIAKCCHDLDLLSWFIDDKCISVSSNGELSVYKKENAPEGCARMCLDCKYIKDCPYSAEKIYIKDRAEKGFLEWPCDIIVNEPTVEKLYDALKTSPYGRCVYKCDNNVVDHQIVNMQFKNGATAQLTMTAFSQDCYREIHVHCEKGEIYGNMKDNKLFCNIFGKESKVIDVNIVADSAYGHGGGDWRMIDDVLSVYSGKEAKNLTTIDNSMQSHYIGFNAEISRRNGGKNIKL